MKLLTIAVTIVIAMATTFSIAHAGACAPKLGISLDQDVSTGGYSPSEDLSIGLNLTWELGHNSKCAQEKHDATRAKARAELEVLKVVTETAKAREKSAEADQDEIRALSQKLTLCIRASTTEARVLIEMCEKEGFL